MAAQRRQHGHPPVRRRLEGDVQTNGPPKKIQVGLKPCGGDLDNWYVRGGKGLDLLDPGLLPQCIRNYLEVPQGWGVQKGKGVRHAKQGHGGGGLGGHDSHKAEPAYGQRTWSVADDYIDVAVGNGKPIGKGAKHLQDSLCKKQGESHERRGPTLGGLIRFIWQSGSSTKGTCESSPGTIAVASECSRASVFSSKPRR
jgi:hypothetical protein